MNSVMKDRQTWILMRWISCNRLVALLFRLFPGGLLTLLYACGTVIHGAIIIRRARCLSPLRIDKDDMAIE